MAEILKTKKRYQCAAAFGSVVTKDMSEFAIVGGVPERIIKWRKKKSDVS